MDRTRRASYLLFDDEIASGSTGLIIVTGDDISVVKDRIANYLTEMVIRMTADARPRRGSRMAMTRNETREAE